MLLKRHRESDQGMGWRRKTELAALLHISPLLIEIECKRMGVSLRRGQQITTGNDIGKARHTLDAFIGGGNHDIDPHTLHRDIHGTEARHGIQDHDATSLLSDSRNIFDRVDDAACGFALDHENRADIGIGLE